MNFVVANEVNKGPILVGTKKGVRDWGDARNEGEGREEREVGLSSRKGEHRKRRGECIGEFHRLMGKMPLRYGYGKVMDDIGEQGLCEKGGEGREEREVGLSSRKPEHRKRRGECIGEFHRLLGKMSLRYGYRKSDG
ncbi:Glycosyltransferase family protein 64 C3 [Capsicum annuum]|uniref:Glycosyltransferase family protein 64 C3 n=1 Tax=Capsicum annuum TaxID=4072 RepID=A0A2G3ANS8_CAPAN|nr:Glycosyltransferase family protein 64 C3 [Capsicum annuum]